MEKFALHSIKSGRASSDLALRNVDIETCWLKELQDQAKICEINSKSYFKGRESYQTLSKRSPYTPEA